MSEYSYDDMVMVVKDYLDAPPDLDMTLTEATQALDKAMRQRGVPDTLANMLMVQFAALIDRSRMGAIPKPNPTNIE